MAPDSVQLWYSVSTVVLLLAPSKRGSLTTNLRSKVILGSIRHCSDGYIKGDGMGRAQSYSLRVDVSRVEGCHGEKALGRSRSGWEENIKSFFFQRNSVWRCVLIYVFQNRRRWLTVVNMLMNIQIPCTPDDEKPTDLCRQDVFVQCTPAVLRSEQDFSPPFV